MPEIDGFEQAYSPPRNRGFNGLHLEPRDLVNLNLILKNQAIVIAMVDRQR
jgi:hypothetical protein